MATSQKLDENNAMVNEPYRLFFPIGLFFLIWGASVWLSQIWGAAVYPLELHRSLVINGFIGSFMGGFLMTAIPQFSQTHRPYLVEVLIYLLVTLAVPAFTLFENPRPALVFSALQAFILLVFMGHRIIKRKCNPPYSFIFVFIGLLLWLTASAAQLYSSNDLYKTLHHEAALASLILGVGARLIPGILGHSDIVQAQKARYEKVDSLLKTIPLGFVFLVLTFVASYFLPEQSSQWVQAGVVCVIALAHWRIHQLPTKKTHLSWSLWVCAVSIALSFLIQPLLYEAHIHVTHAFFINGAVLLSFLVATRVSCAHGPGVDFENTRWVSIVTGLILLGSATRVSAYFLPDSYFTHLGYSSVILVLAAVLWGLKFLPYLKIVPVK